MRQARHRSKHDGEVNPLPAAKSELSHPTRSELRRGGNPHVEVRSANGRFEPRIGQTHLSWCFSSHGAPIRRTLSSLFFSFVLRTSYSTFGKSRLEIAFSATGFSGSSSRAFTY